MNPIWRGVAELLECMTSTDHGGERALKQFFREHPKLGRRDRGLIADSVYGCLRHQRSLDYALDNQADGADARLAAWLCLYAGWRPAQASVALGCDERLEQALTRLQAPSNADPATRAELPDWLYSELCRILPPSEALELGLALQQHAPLDLRVNTLLCKPGKARTALAAENMDFVATPWSPSGLRHDGRLPIHRSKAYTLGWVEVQDEGSQLVAPLLQPRRGETIVDLCAGAGGKTLHLAALMANQGRIYAFDPSARRLEELKQRCLRARVSTVVASRIEDERAAAVQRLHGKVDRVLIDAPCSGTGTLRRHPEIRWQAHDIAALTATQDRLIDAGAKLLRPGGRLVYATCSLLPTENEQRTQAFSARHPEFTPIELPPILKNRKISLTVSDAATELRLYPHRHGCDGFFAAVFEKAK